MKSQILRASVFVSYAKTAIAWTSMIYAMTSGHALAQSAPNSASWKIREEVVVVGTRDQGYSASAAEVIKGGVPLIEWPQSVQVLNRTLLEEQNQQSLTSALRNVSGVVPSHEQESVLVNPFVRGQEAEVLLDGLVSYGDTAVIDPASLIAFERVEVAKGPTSTQYGGGVGAPTGGLINLVTKTPKADPAYYFGLRGGSFDTRAAEMDVNQPLNDRVAVRLAAEWYDSEDMVDDIAVERLTLNPSFSAVLGAGTDLTVRGFYSSIDQLEYSGLPAEVVGLPGVDTNQFTGAANAPDTTIENLSLHATVRHAFSNQLTGLLQMRYFENTFDEFSSFPFFSAFPLEGTRAPIIRGQLPVETEEYTLDAQLEYQLTGSGSMDHALLLGLTWDATDYEAGSGFDFTPIGVIDYASPVNVLDFGATPPIDSVTENEYRTLAVYLQDYITLGEHWRILLSGRLTEYGLDEVVGGTGADESYTEFDPRVGVTYRVNEEVSFFAGYATGSRMVPFFTGVDSSAPVPEESASWEAGVKFASERWSGTLAAFRLDRENIPQTDLADPFFGSVQNGEQRSEGLEMDVVWEPSDSLSLLANASFVNSENRTEIASFGTIFAEGNQLSRVPETSGRLAARYRFLNGPLRGLGLGLGMTYADEAPLTDANIFYSDDYLVFDLQADYNVGPWIFRLNVVNLLDEEYVMPYQFLLQEVVRPGMERAAFVSVGVGL
ncbi:MAG: TonB-dependent siderophore receptor [Pseudomonadota bacterium]